KKSHCSGREPTRRSRRSLAEPLKRSVARELRRFSRVTVVAALFALIGFAGPSWTSASQKKDAKAAASATFEMYKDNSDAFRFRLKDADGDIMATSGKGYKTKADCEKIVEWIKKNAAGAK